MDPNPNPNPNWRNGEIQGEMESAEVAILDAEEEARLEKARVARDSEGPNAKRARKEAEFKKKIKIAVADIMRIDGGTQAQEESERLLDRIEGLKTQIFKAQKAMLATPPPSEDGLSDLNKELTALEKSLDSEMKLASKRSDSKTELVEEYSRLSDKAQNARSNENQARGAYESSSKELSLVIETGDLVNVGALEAALDGKRSLLKDVRAARDDLERLLWEETLKPNPNPNPNLERLLWEARVS